MRTSLQRDDRRIRLRDRERLRLEDDLARPRPSQVRTQPAGDSYRLGGEQPATVLGWQAFSMGTRAGGTPAAGGAPVPGGTSVAGGRRLDSPAAIRDYIENRTRDLPPTPESLELIAKEVTERGGTIAIATHAGGTLQSDDAIILEDGSTIDLIGSVGSPDAKWQWLHHGESYGATYDPDRNVVDPRTGEMKTFAEFLGERGKPVPPYIPLIDDGGGAAGGLDHLSGWVVDGDRARKKDDDPEGAPPARTYKPMPGFDAARLNDLTDVGPAMVFARWMQDNNMPPTLDSLKAFVAANPDFEMQGDQIRIKPEALSKYGTDPELGRWHTALTTVDGQPQFSFTPAEAAAARPTRRSFQLMENA